MARRAMATMSLADARLAVEYDISKPGVELLFAVADPPEPVLQIFKATFAVLAEKHGSWEDMPKDVRKLVCGVIALEPQKDDHRWVVAALQPFLEQKALYPECLRPFSPVCEILCRWCRAVYVACGGSLAFGAAPPDVLQAAEEAAAAFHQALHPQLKLRPKAAKQHDTKAQEEEAGGSDEKDRNGVPRLARELLVRSMVSGEVVATLRGASREWTWRDVTAELRKEMPRQQGLSWQLFHGEQLIDKYATLSSLGIDTEPGKAGEVSMVAVSLVDPDKLMSEEEAHENLLHVRGKFLTRKDLNDVAWLRSPPPLVEMVVAAVCAVFDIEEPWERARKLFTDPKFMKKMFEADGTNISDEGLVALQWYVEHPDFDREKVKKISGSCYGLAIWCLAIYNVALVTAHRKQQGGEAE